MRCCDEEEVELREWGLVAGVLADRCADLLAGDGDHLGNMGEMK